MDNSSGVGVLDKAALVLTALESGPATLAGLVAGTGLARPTAHRLAVALEHHRLVARDMQGRFVLGPRLAELSAAAGEDRLLATAGPVLARLRDITGESAQLWRRQGEHRVCVAAAERPSGLRDTIPVGSQLTMRAGSAAQVLLAWEDPERMHRGLQNAAFSAAALSGIRRRGWAQSVGEREQGVASVSAPVRSPGGKVIAAVSVSGPLERLSRQPGRMHAPAVLAAAERLSRVAAPRCGRVAVDLARDRSSTRRVRARAGRRVCSEQRILLELEEQLLALEAAGVAGEGAVGADDAVARDHDRDRVAAVGEADGARGGVGHAEPAARSRRTTRSRPSRRRAAGPTPAAGSRCRPAPSGRSNSLRSRSK